jgi:NAD+ synthase
MIKNIEKQVEQITKWIKEYVQASHSKGVVVGNSGGKDSATVIALATKALGKDKVVTIAMPCNSINADFEDAKLVADKFGVPLLKADLTETYQTLEKELNQIVEPNSEAKINAKPRLRMTTLYYVAQSLNYLVIGTGNKCEATVGYTTKWGDSAHDFNPIGDFTVDEVLQIGKYLGVPDKIIKKAPNDGLGKLTDEEKLGVTYKQIAEYIETGKTEEKAMSIIKKKEQMSMHKRTKIPVYKRLENN